MSIDTANKRRSALNSVPLIVYPTADGTIDSANREQVTWLYAGLAGAASLIVLTTPANRILIYTRMPRVVVEYAEGRAVSFHSQRRSIIEYGTPRVVNVNSQKRGVS